MVLQFLPGDANIMEQSRRVRQAVKPQPSQGCITGSNPVRATIKKLLLYIKEFLFYVQIV